MISRASELITEMNFNPLAPRVNPSVLTFDSMEKSLTIYLKAVEQYFAVVLFVFSIFPSL